jgi:hypothetical protein
MISVNKMPGEPLAFDEDLGPLIPFKDACADLGIGRRTGGRRMRDDPDFCKTLVEINGRIYSIKKRHEAYKRRRIARAMAERQS